MAHTLYQDVGVETLYTDYSIWYTVRPMHILFRPCGLTLNKRNDRQRSPTAIMQTNSSMRMRRVRINVMGVVLSINDRRKRVTGRGLCEPFTKKKFAYGASCYTIRGKLLQRNVLPLFVMRTHILCPVVNLSCCILPILFWTHSWTNHN